MLLNSSLNSLEICMLMRMMTRWPFHADAERSSRLSQSRSLFLFPKITGVCVCNQSKTSLQASALIQQWVGGKLCILTAQPVCKYASHRSLVCFGVKATCIPAGGIVGLQESWLEHYPTRGPHRTAICCSLYSFTLSAHSCNIHNSDKRGMSLGSEPPAGFY